ncbi:MAG: HEAT repeat domain-containing protein [Chlamydiia bacterium]|nr:HEAT repeat domain-containing protein [Chlamydiia bacterium]
MKWLCILPLLFYAPLLGGFSPAQKGKILYALHIGETKKALDAYLEGVDETKTQDFDLLSEIAKMLIEKGARSSDPETQLLSIFGASIALDSTLLPIFEIGLNSKQMLTQLAALDGLINLHDDEADLLIHQALSSPFLLVRLEAAYKLSAKNDPNIAGHMQALALKVPPPILPLFPQILVQLQYPSATRMLRQLLTDSDVQVRIESIRFIAKEKRDDFLPQIQRQLTSPNRGEQEACALALGQLDDHSSLPSLRQLAKASEIEVRLAALASLVTLGETETIEGIIEIASQKNLFAAVLLGELGNGCGKERIEKIVQCLENLLQETDYSIRLNAMLALLKLKRLPKGAPLSEFLIRDARDLGMIINRSPGRGLAAASVHPSATCLTKRHPGMIAQTQLIKEEILRETLEQSEEVFLETVATIFQHNETTLIPLSVELLCNHKSERALNFLKKMEQKAGAPFIRTYCTLALYYAGEEEGYGKKIITWLDQEKSLPPIRFREDKIASDPDRMTSYTLSPEETSRLMILALELLLKKESEAGVSALVKMMCHDTSKNKYAIAGLLIKGVE